MAPFIRVHSDEGVKRYGRKLDPTPEVNGRYGAPMGRPTTTEHTVNDQAAPMRLVRVRLDSGGYDAGGAYWGLGEPLYYFEASPAGLVSGYVRGKTREDAKRAVRELHAAARFYR